MLELLADEGSTRLGGAVGSAVSDGGSAPAVGFRSPSTPVP
jgi:hypothetical protein